MARIVLIVLALGFSALIGGRPALADSTAVDRVRPSEDVSFPFWCDWSYDWESRCWRDFSERLPVGGDEDKVWRAGLRFPLAGIPSGAYVVSAALSLSFDGVCLAPRMTTRLCPSRAYTIEVAPIFHADWFHEREVDIGPVVAGGSFWAGTPQRLVFDVTDQVIEWVEYGATNNGLLLKLADGEEEFGVSGPALPSAEFANAALRPRLEVVYGMS